MQFKYHLKLKSSFILMTAYVLGVVRGNLGYFQKPKISFTPPPRHRGSVNFHTPFVIKFFTYHPLPPHPFPQNSVMLTVKLI